MDDTDSADQLSPTVASPTEPTRRTSGADELADLDGLVDTLTTAIRNHERVPESVTINAIYIGGSFGAKAGHGNSDIDVTIEAEGASMPTCHAVSRDLTRSLPPHAGWWPLDPCVLPSSDVVHAHLVDKCTHGDYETVYDVHNDSYIAVDELNPANES